MRYYRDFFIWENHYVQKHLDKFFALFKDYCFAVEDQKTQKMIDTKIIIKEECSTIQGFFYNAGREDLLVYEDEEFGEVDFVERLADIVKANKAKVVFDRLLEIMAVFEGNKGKAWANTLNPLHWLLTGLYLLNEVVLYPFYYFSKTKEVAKNSLFWRTIKFVLLVFELIVIFIVLIYLLGWDDEFKAFLEL